MSDAPNLMALPDWAVISDQRAAEILDLSLDTLWRLDRAGDGPPRVRLSPAGMAALSAHFASGWHSVQPLPQRATQRTRQKRALREHGRALRLDCRNP